MRDRCALLCQDVMCVGSGYLGTRIEMLSHDRLEMLFSQQEHWSLMYEPVGVSNGRGRHDGRRQLIGVGMTEGDN